MQAGGRRFDPVWLHHFEPLCTKRKSNPPVEGLEAKKAMRARLEWLGAGGHRRIIETSLAGAVFAPAGSFDIVKRRIACHLGPYPGLRQTFLAKPTFDLTVDVRGFSPARVRVAGIDNENDQVP